MNSRHNIEYSSHRLTLVQSYHCSQMMRSRDHIQHELHVYHVSFIISDLNLDLFNTDNTVKDIMSWCLHLILVTNDCQ